MFIKVKKFKNQNVFMFKGLYSIGGEVYFVDESAIYQSEDPVDVSSERSNAIRLSDGDVGVLIIDRKDYEDPDCIHCFEFMPDLYNEDLTYTEDLFVDMLDFLEEDEDFQFEFGDKFYDIIKKNEYLFDRPYSYQEEDVVTLEYEGGLENRCKLIAGDYSLRAEVSLYLHDKKIAKLEDVDLGLLDVEDPEEFILENDFSEIVFEKVSI